MLHNSVRHRFHRCLFAARKWAVACLLGGFSVLSSAVAIQPAASVPDGWVKVAAPFAWRAPLNDETSAAVLRRVPMPMQLYETAVQSSLGDVRVVDARGRVMPYAWVPREDAQATARDTPVRVHALLGAADQDPRKNMPIDAERGEEGAIAGFTVSGAAGRGRTEIGSVLDLSGLAGEVHAIVFDDFESDSQVHAFVLEASEDLKQWHTLRQEAHIVRLAQSGQVIQQNRVEIAPLQVAQARYLRLRWYRPASSPNLKQIAVRLTPAPTTAPVFNWTEPLAPVEGSDRDFQYTAPPAMPIERLRINLPQANVMAPVRVYSYNAAALSAPPAVPGDASAGQTPSAPQTADLWRGQAHAVAYRMQAEVGEIVSPDVLLSGAPMARFRVLVDAARSLGGTPTVQIGFTPRTLVFSAQGEAPYSLAWGSASLPDAALPFETLSGGSAARPWLDNVATVYPGQRISADGMMLAQPAPPPSELTVGETTGRWLMGPGLTSLLLIADLWLGLLAWRAWRRWQHAA